MSYAIKRADRIGRPQGSQFFEGTTPFPKGPEYESTRETEEGANSFREQEVEGKEEYRSVKSEDFPEVPKGSPGSGSTSLSKK